MAICVKIKSIFKYESVLSAYMHLYMTFRFDFFFELPQCILSHSVNGNEVSD